MAAPATPGFGALAPYARAFIGAVVLLAAAAVGAAQTLVELGSPDLALLGLLLTLCVAFGAHEVLLPGGTSLQPSLVAFVCGAVLLPPWAIASLALACFLPGWALNGAPWYQIAFNASNFTIAGLVAAALAGAGETFSSGPAPSAVGVGALLLAAAVFVIVNHSLIALAIGLADPRHGHDRLRTALESASLDLALAVTGACVAVLWQTGPQLALLGLGPVLLVFRALAVPLLRHQTRSDPKTGLANFGHLSASLEAAVATAARLDAPLSVVMVDMDHLRRINDRCGHLAGDRAIRGVADVLAGIVRLPGLAARFGGEEFCLLLPGARAADALRIAERARVGVHSIALRADDDPGDVAVTVSLGVASFPQHGTSVEELLGAADEAVYAAKACGRDRVCLAGDDPRHALGGQTKDAAAGTDRAPTPEPTPTPEPKPERAIVGGQRAVAAYATALTALAVAVGALSGPGRVGERPALFALLVCSVILLDLITLDLFGRGRISPGSIPVIALAALFGPCGPVLAEAAVALVRLARRERPLKAAFNFGSLALTGAVAATVFELISPVGDRGIIVAGLVAGLAYYAVNALLVTAVWALDEGIEPLAAWRERFAWSLPHHAIFGLAAGTMLVTEQRLGLSALLVFALPIAAMWLAERQYVQRSRHSVATLRRGHDELAAANRRLRRLLGDNQRMLGRMRRTHVSAIASLARTIEAKDHYTGGHTERVARMSLLLGEEFGFDEAQRAALEVGAVIHDIGKIGIADAILLKQDALDEQERLEMRRHPEISSYIVAELELPQIVKQVVRSHHERYDGSGYPDRLRGEEIPLSARIVAVTDALDAMTTDRPYRTALSFGAALDEIEAGAGRQFCPRVVGALVASLIKRTDQWKALGLPVVEAGLDERLSAGLLKRRTAGHVAPEPQVTRDAASA